MSTQTTRRTLRSLLGGTMALICATAVLAAPLPALAGPDDGKIIGADAHVDSPKIFWEGDTFDLRSEIGYDLNPIDKTVNYLGQGYDNRGQTFMFTPEGQPELSFLGPDAGTWYMAPQLPYGNHSPIWAGFGADAAIPVEKFRDAVFTLDLVGIDGPGRMEALAWTPASEGFPATAFRLLSSTDSRYRSKLMTAGDHTHNYTLFSHPGRYEVHFRAVARGTDGKLIHSKDQTLVWQVGGAKPGTSLPGKSDTPLTPATQPTFQISPATTGSKDPKVVERMSNIRVDLGKAVDGKAVVTVNGFHYTDLTITGGVGQFQDLLGVGAANYQVKVTGKDGTEWTSAPLAYTAGNPLVSTTESGTLAEPTAAPAQSFPLTPVTFEREAAFTLKFGPGKDSHTRAVQLTFDDPKFTGIFKFGAFAAADAKHPDESSTEHVPSGGVLESEVGVSEDWAKDKHVIIDILPHPLMANLKSARYEVTDKYDLTKNYEFKGVLALATGSDSTPTPTPTPTPGTCPSGLVILDNGHIDMSAISEGNKLKIAIKDDTRIAAKESVDRPLNTVGILASDRAVVKRDAKFGAEWDQILAPTDQNSWVLPMTQTEGLPWPGYSTERTDHKQFPGGVRLELVAKEGPGDVAMFLADSLGGPPKVLFGSRDGAPKEIKITEATHAHAGWAFTKPGVYKLSFRYVGVGADGTETATETQVLSFGAGTAARAELCAKESGAVPDPGGVNPGAPTPGAPDPGLGAEPGAGSGGDLPRTGFEVLPFAMIAAFLIAGGAGVLFARRKKSAVRG